MNAYKRVAKILKALAHPARMRILETLLDEEEACVCHLEQRLGLRQAYLSQQLAKLRDVGLVRDRRDGLNNYYAIAAEGVDRLIKDARRLGTDLAALDGLELRFPPLAPASANPCGCPRCIANVPQPAS